MRTGARATPEASTSGAVVLRPVLSQADRGFRTASLRCLELPATARDERREATSK